MISVSIWRKTLEAQGACAEGLALFDAIAVQQPRTDPRRLRRIRIPRWTALHWIMLVQAGFGEWCATRGIVPRANLYGASLRGANLYDLLRAGYVPLAAQPDPGTLQHLRDAVKERDEAESHAEMRARILTARAEKAERERDDLLARINQAEEAARALRAELARLTALDRATDDELVDLYRKIYETHGGGTISVSHDDCRRAGLLAVAARVRQERCLVAQAVAADCDIHVTEQISGMWCVRVVAQTSSTAAGVSATVPRADAPSTLARLLGEVSRG